MLRDPSNFSDFAADMKTALSEKNNTKLGESLDEIRNNIEIVHTPVYEQLLENFVPVFVEVLEKIPPQFVDNEEHKLRSSVMMIITRLPTTEFIRKFALQLLKGCLDVLEHDNEENGLLSVKFAIELVRVVSDSFQRKVIVADRDIHHLFHRIRDFFLECCRRFSQNVSRFLEPQSSAGDSAAADGEKKLLSSCDSFRILVEFPLLIVLLMQSFERVVSHSEYRTCLESMRGCLSVEKSENDIRDDPVAQEDYGNYIMLQVKMASFLAYYLRTMEEFIPEYQDFVPRVVVSLLRRCPSHLISTRRELLVVIRHLLEMQTRSKDSTAEDISAPPFVNSFLEHVTVLLEEDVLLGKSRTAHETLRPLAYSTLADLIHHLRSFLDLEKIKMTVTFFARALFDLSLNLSIQTISAKLLVHLVESIFKMNSTREEEGKTMLLHEMLHLFARKFCSLVHHISPDRQSLITAGTEDTETRHREDPTTDDQADASDSSSSSPTSTDPDFFHRPGMLSFRSLFEARLLVKMLIVGIKNAAYTLIPRVRDPTAKRSASTPFSLEEINLFRKVLVYGLEVFNTFFVLGGTPMDEKMNIENFSKMFATLDPRTFRDIFSSEMGSLFDYIVKNNTFLMIPATMVKDEAAAKPFIDLTLGFLLRRMEVLADKTPRAEAALSLFKLAFQVMGGKEDVFISHMNEIVRQCMSKATRLSNPVNYLYVLRYLFRSIVSEKIDRLYKVFQGFLHEMLKTFTSMLRANVHQPMRDLLVELCLAIPARMYVLLPHIEMLIEPVILALKSSNQALPHLGLRTLDIWIDSLRPEGFERVIQGSVDKLMEAIWMHLKVLNVGKNYSVAMRILGKLGGRNRQFLKHPQSLVHSDVPYNGYTMKFFRQDEFDGYTSFSLPMDEFITFAAESFMYNGSETLKTKQKLCEMLQTVLMSLIQPDDGDGGEAIPHTHKRKLPASSRGAHYLISRCSHGTLPYYGGTEGSDEMCPSPGMFAEQQEMVKKIMLGIFAGFTVPELRESTDAFLNGFMASVAAPLLYNEHGRYGCGGKIVAMNPDIILDAICDGYSQLDDRDVYRGAERSLEHLSKHVRSLVSSEMDARWMALWDRYAMRVRHSCYVKDWRGKVGGCKAITSLLNFVSRDWFRRHEVDFIKALLFIIKDSPKSAMVHTVSDANFALQSLVRYCHTDVPEDQGTERSRPLHDALSMLVSELSSSTLNVRTTVQKLIYLLSEITGRQITQSLESFRESLARSITSQRFRGLSLLLQTGFCEAMTFFLSLNPSLLIINEEVIKIVTQAYGIARENTRKLVGKSNDTAAGTQLQLACMKLLRAALCCPDFRREAPAGILEGIVNQFFKFLQSPQPDFWVVSKAGLKTAILRGWLSKDLLQRCIHPMVSHVKKTQLKPQALDGLYHLFDLKTSLVSANLGEQLLGHLKGFVESPKTKREGPGTLPVDDAMAVEEDSGAQRVDPGSAEPTVHQKIKIAQRLIDLFHLLPKEANKMTASLVSVVLELEETWCENWSPNHSRLFPPLVKFLSRYPQTTLDLFLQKLKDDRYFHLFIYILKQTSSVRFALSRSKKALLETSFCRKEGHSTDTHYLLSFRGVVIIRILSKFIPSVLCDSDSDKIFENLNALWEELPSIPEVSPTLRHTMVKEMLVKIFMQYFEIRRDPVTIFRLLMSYMDTNVITEHSILDAFFWEIVPDVHEISETVTIMTSAIERLQSGETSDAMKRCILSKFILPFLTALSTNPKVDELISEDIIHKFCTVLFDDRLQRVDAICLEVLQVGVLFVCRYHKSISLVKKNILKFAVGRSQSEDLMTLLTSSLLISFFARNFELPGKIVTSTYANLLKTHQSEGKQLVRRALDVLVPVIPQRIDAKEKPDQWLQWTRKRMVNEGHVLPQLFQIWQLIIRHKDVFYPARAMFVPQIVKPFNRLEAVHGHHSLENKKFVLDLIDLVLYWEEKSVEEEKTAEMEVEGQSEPRSNASDSFHPSPSLRATIVNMLLRLAMPILDPRRVDLSIHVSLQCLKLLERVLNAWPDVHCKMSYIEKLLQNCDAVSRKRDMGEKRSIHLSVGLEALYALLKRQMSTFVEQHFRFRGALEPFLSSPIPVIIAGVEKVLGLLMEKYPWGSDDLPLEVKELYVFLEKYVKVRLEEDQLHEKDDFEHVLSIMTSISKHSHSFIVQYVHPFLRLLKFIESKAHKCQENHEKERRRMSAMPQASREEYDRKVKEYRDEIRTFVQKQILIVDILGQFGLDQPSVRKVLHDVFLTHTSEPMMLLKCIQHVERWILTHPGEEDEKVRFIKDVIAFDGGKDPEYSSQVFKFVRRVHSHFSEQPGSTLLARVRNYCFVGLKSKVREVREGFLEALRKEFSGGIYAWFLFVTQSDNWETISETFWIQHAVDLFFNCVDETCKVEVASGQLFFPSWIKHESHNSFSGEEGAMEIEESSAPLTECVAFSKLRSETNYTSIVAGLREIVALSEDLAERCWVNVFSLAWSSLHEDEREALTRPMILLLTRDYQKNQYAKSPNVVRCLLEGMTKCNPPIPIAPEVLKFTGKTFNAWHISLPVLESMLMKSCASPGSLLTDTSAECLIDLYKLLSEEDVLTGIYRILPFSPMMKLYLSLEQHGEWVLGQIVLKESMEKLDDGSECMVLERTLHEDKFLSIARKLQQWDDLERFAEQEKFDRMKLECMWTKGEWEPFNQILSEKPTVHDIHQLKLFQITLSIIRGKPNTEFHCSHAQSLALQRWSALPAFRTHSHTLMLHNFQQLFELQESNRIVSEVNSMTTSSVKDISAPFSLWRERLLNEWEDIGMWSDILTWRCHCFTHIVSISKVTTDVETETPGGHRRRTKSPAAIAALEYLQAKNTFAKIARKHHLHDVCRTALLDAQRHVIDYKRFVESSITYYEYLSLYEQAKCDLHYDHTLASGLENISRKQSDFILIQKTDIGRLRGEFHHRLGQIDQAFTEFAEAARQFPVSAKIWLSWGRFCDSIFQKHEKEIVWAEYTIDCYIHAVRFGGNSAWNYIPRVLWLLHYDNEKRQLTDALRSCTEQMPPWQWLPWISHLIAGLSRPEAELMKSYLLVIAKTYPQAVYYQLRAFYYSLRGHIASHQERMRGHPGLGVIGRSSGMDGDPSGVGKDGADGRMMMEDHRGKKDGLDTDKSAVMDIEDKAGSRGRDEMDIGHGSRQPVSRSRSASLSSGRRMPPELMHVRALTEEIMTIVLQSFESFLRELETLVKEISKKLKPDSEEELLRSLEVILKKCYRYYVKPTTSIPEEIWNEVVHVATSHFGGEDGRLSRFQREHRDAMRRSLLAPSEGGRAPENLAAYVSEVKKWVVMLHERMRLAPTVVPLEALSSYVAEFRGTETEVPGQYRHMSEPCTDKHEKLECFLPEVDIVRRGELRCRRLTARSDAGNLYHFVLQSTTSRTTEMARSEERMWELVIHLNRIVDRFAESRKRNVQTHVPVIIPISQRLRLIKESSSFVSLEDVLAEHLFDRGLPLDTDIVAFWANCEEQERSVSQWYSRKDAFEHVCKNVLPSTMILHDYFLNLFSSWTQFYTFRKQFTVQLGMTSLLSHILFAHKRSPENVLISPATGDISQLSFTPTYDVHGGLVEDDGVTFRLTRNVVSLIGKFGVEGTFLGSISSTAHAFKRYKHLVESFVCMFCRDELLAWKLTHFPEEPHADVEGLFRNRVQDNLGKIMDRVNMCLPLSGAEAIERQQIMNVNVHKLVQAAQDPAKLCLMDPCWHPFF